MSPRHIDQIARDLAGGEISRRSALRRLAGAGLGIGAAMAPAGVAEAMAGCSGGRVKCKGKCCPKNAKCKNGKCKCKSGFTKCGKKCVDTETSVKHCGACGNPCGDGETCEAGECVGGDVCGDGQIGPSETCDGANLGGESCVSLGFTGGTLACAGDCQSYDTSGCTDQGLCEGVTCTQQDQCHDIGVCNPETGNCSNPPKLDNTPCNDGSACTQSDTCQAGVCVGGAPVVCTALDECHDAGTCSPATGNCSNPQKPDGSPCSSGTCAGGVCTCQPSCAPGSCDVDDGCGGICGCSGGQICNTATDLCEDPR